MYDIWWGLAWLEIKQRYSRSVIGPFWITLSTGVMVAAMGPLYGVLLGQNVRHEWLLCGGYLLFWEWWENGYFANLDRLGKMQWW